MTFWKKKKRPEVVGLDIGTRRGQGGRAQAEGVGIRTGRYFWIAHVPAGAIQGGEVKHPDAVQQAIRQALVQGGVQATEAVIGGRGLRDRQAGQLAEDVGERARRVHPLGGRAAHPLRHRRRQHRLPDPAAGRASARSDAGGGQEGQGPELRGRRRGLRVERRGGGRRRVRPGDAIPAQRVRPGGRGRGAGEHRARDDEHEHHAGRSERLRAGHLRRRPAVRLDDRPALRSRRPPTQRRSFGESRAR